MRGSADLVTLSEAVTKPRLRHLHIAAFAPLGSSVPAKVSLEPGARLHCAETSYSRNGNLDAMPKMLH